MSFPPKLVQLLVCLEVVTLPGAPNFLMRNNNLYVAHYILYRKIGINCKCFTTKRLGKKVKTKHSTLKNWCTIEKKLPIMIFFSLFIIIFGGIWIQTVVLCLPKIESVLWLVHGLSCLLITRAISHTSAHELYVQLLSVFPQRSTFMD